MLFCCWRRSKNRCENVAEGDKLRNEKTGVSNTWKLPQSDLIPQWRRWGSAALLRSSSCEPPWPQLNERGDRNPLLAAGQNFNYSWSITALFERWRPLLSRSDGVTARRRFTAGACVCGYQHESTSAAQTVSGTLVLFSQSNSCPIARAPGLNLTTPKHSSASECLLPEATTISGTVHSADKHAQISNQPGECNMRKPPG